MEDELMPFVYTAMRKPRTRAGRGFSLEEIKQAGMSVRKAEKLEIPIDKRRRTAHSENVQVLKEQFQLSIPLTEIGGIGTATEERLVKAGILDAYDLVHTNVDATAKKVRCSKKTLKRWQDEAEKLLQEQQT